MTDPFRPQGDRKQATFTNDLKEGFRGLWRHRLLRRFAIALGVLNASSMAAGATVVLFAQKILGLDATGFGLLSSAGAVGGVAGSFLAARLSKWLGSGGNLLVSLVTLGLSSAVMDSRPVRLWHW